MDYWLFLFGKVWDRTLEIMIDWHVFILLGIITIIGILWLIFGYIESK